MTTSATIDQSNTDHLANAPGGDRKTAFALFISFLLLFGYFFQGGGWNQNAFIDMTYAIVNDFTIDITPYANNTGDAAQVGSRIYALKSPGLAIWTSVFFYPVHLIEAAADVDVSQPFWQNLNAHVMNLFGAALPGAMVVVGLFVFFRYRNLSPRAAMGLAAAFGCGSLIFPYAGSLMRENLLAACLLWAWLLVGIKPTVRKSVAAGVLLGVALMTDMVIAPLLAAWLIILFIERRFSKPMWGVLLPMVFAGLVLGAINWAHFGKPWHTVYTHIPDSFTDQDLFMGVFGAPEFSRVYWLTFHHYRGIFFCCPVLLLGFGFLFRFKAILQRDTMHFLAFITIGFYCVFNLCFNGWSGGFGIGPRYLSPMLPMFFSFAYLGWPLLRWLALPLASLSSYIMLGVTSVMTMIPARNFGPPPPEFNPVFEALKRFHVGRLSMNTQSVMEYLKSKASAADQFDSYNLGELMGLEGLHSLWPLLVVAMVGVGVLLYLTRKVTEA